MEKLLRNKTACCGKAFDLFHSLLKKRYHTSPKKFELSEQLIRTFIEGNAKETLIARSQNQIRSHKSKHGHNLFNSLKVEAGVLVPICIVNERICVLYTLRSSNLNSHRSEVSFPGGKRDVGDRTTQDAAIRETCEELGIEQSKLTIWAPLRQLPNRQNTILICPFICYMGHLDLSTLAVNHQEVSEVFAIPIYDLLDGRNQNYTSFRDGWRMPVFTVAPLKVWGISAMITDFFLSILYPDLYRSQLSIVRRQKIIS